MKRHRIKYIVIAVIIGIILVGTVIYILIRRSDRMDLNITENMTVTSDAFKNGGTIPIKYTGEGEDVSPALKLSSVSPEAKSIAVIMDDLDIPFGPFNHWVIWNIPVMNHIPEGIPAGAEVSSLGGAMQGIGYGKNRYAGPKPPKKSTHRYKYQVYVLDTKLNLNSRAHKKDLLKQMQGHILQYGSITGKYH
jgi:Raf kinase inhibitor-like YbhB/YbcL family protein